MQITLSQIWSQVADSIFYDNRRYTNWTSFQLQVFYEMELLTLHSKFSFNWGYRQIDFCLFQEYFRDISSLFGIQNCPSSRLIEIQNCPSSRLIEIQNHTSSRLIEVQVSTSSRLIEIQNCTSSRLIEIQDSTSSWLIEIQNCSSSGLIEIQNCTSSRLVLLRLDSTVWVFILFIAGRWGEYMDSFFSHERKLKKIKILKIKKKLRKLRKLKSWLAVDIHFWDECKKKIKGHRNISWQKLSHDFQQSWFPSWFKSIWE